MKKRLISLISALAMIVSMLATVASADVVGTLELGVGTDSEGYYYVDILFSAPNATLDIVKTKTVSRKDYYQGTGLIGGQVNIENMSLDIIYEVLTDAGLPATANLDGTVYKVSLGANSIAEMVAADETGKATLVRIGTNYSTADKTEDEIKEMFSEISYMNAKIVTVEEETVGSTNPALFTITTYATYDGDYGLEMKGDEPDPTEAPTSTPEPTPTVAPTEAPTATPEVTPAPTAEPTATPVPEVIPSATAPGVVDAVKIGDSYVGDKSAADKSAAVAAGLMSDVTPANKVLWTVTAGTTTKTYEQEIASIEGGATVKVGLIIFGLAQDAITAVTAVLQ